MYMSLMVNPSVIIQITKALGFDEWVVVLINKVWCITYSVASSLILIRTAIQANVSIITPIVSSRRIIVIPSIVVRCIFVVSNIGLTCTIDEVVMMDGVV